MGQDVVNVGNVNAKGVCYGKKIKDFHASAWISYGLLAQRASVEN